MEMTFDRENMKFGIQEEINANYSNPDFNVETLSKNFNLSASYFRDIVIELFSISPQKLLECERMLHAMQLIIKGEKINKIARKVGYSNTRSFRQAFHTQYLYCPSIYRRLHESCSINKSLHIQKYCIYYQNSS